MTYETGISARNLPNSKHECSVPVGVSSATRVQIWKLFQTEIMSLPCVFRRTVKIIRSSLLPLLKNAVVWLRTLRPVNRAGSRSKLQLDQIEEAMRLMNFAQELHEDTRRELCQVLLQQHTFYFRHGHDGYGSGWSPHDCSQNLMSSPVGVGHVPQKRAGPSRRSHSTFLCHMLVAHFAALLLA